MPDHVDEVARPVAALQATRDIAVAVRSGENDDGCFHGSARSLLLNFDAVVLDHCVGQQLAAHFVALRLGFVRVRFFEIEFDVTANSDAIDAGKSETFQRMANGFALRVENAVFQGNVPLPSLLHCLRSLGIDRAAFRQNAETTGDFLIGL